MFEHVFETYGTEHAAMVANVIQYRYPMAIRDVGKALGLPEADIDKLAKRMRGRFAGSLVEEMAAMPEFARRMQLADLAGRSSRLVEELRGMPRHLSQHSGGMIISTTPHRRAGAGRSRRRWTAATSASGTRTPSPTPASSRWTSSATPASASSTAALALIEERHGRASIPRDIPLDDPEVYEMIQRGDILGIVQIQSRAQIQVILRLKI